MGVPVDQSHNHFITNIIQPPHSQVLVSSLIAEPFAFDTPNIVNPSGNGAPLIQVVAGDVVEAWLSPDTTWSDASDPGDLLHVNLVPDSEPSAATEIARYDFTVMGPSFIDDDVYAVREANALINWGNYDGLTHVRVVVLSSCHLAVAGDFAGDVTEGTGTLYAIISTSI